MEVMTGFNEFLALIVIAPLLFSPFLILVNVIVKAVVRRRYL